MSTEEDNKLQALYQASRDEAPSELLDQRVLRAARNQQRARQPAWLKLGAVAAVLVLSFSVVLQVGQEPFDEVMEEAAVETGETALMSPMHDATPELSVVEPAREFMPDRQTSMTEAEPVRVLPSTAMTPAPMSRSASQDQMTKAPSGFGLAQPNAQRAAPSALSNEVPSSSRERKGSYFVPPRLPVTVEGLKAMAPLLRFEISPTGRQLVYRGDKLVMSMQNDGQDRVFKAWSGSDSLGVDIDWDSPVSRFGNCRESAVYIECPLGDGVTGYFEGDRLDHIEWRQLGP